MITTHLRNLLTAVVCLFAGVTAQAQFTGGVEQYPTTGWEGSPAAFNLSEVATALGTDAVTLGEALDAYISADTPEQLLFYAVVDGADVAWTAETEAANHGFWLDANGAPLAYGDGCYFYVSPYVDADNDELGFNLGQMPNVMQAGDKGEATIKLKFNDKEATFALTLNVIDKPVYDIPEPTTLIEKELNIVGSAEATVEQYPRTGYDSDPVTLVLSDIVEKLGIQSGEILAAVLPDILYCTEYNDGDVEDGGGLKKDSLTNESSADEPGFWLHAIQNEEGEETGECSRAGYSSSDKFFVEAFDFNPETMELSCNLGQYPGNLKDNEKWYANLYIVYGDKAYSLRYNLNILEREEGSGTTGMTKVGETSIDVKLVVDASNYSTTTIHPDVDAIAEALGCEVGAMSMQALDDTENWASPTAGNQGFWFNEAGIVVAWGTASYFFIENPTSMDYSTLNVGQYPGRLNIGDQFSTTLYFINAENYYEYKVNLEIVEPQEFDGQFKEVARRTLTIQQLVDNAYVWSEGVEFGVDFVNETLGTSDWVVYGMALLDENGNEPEGNAKYVKNYTCTPYPGFWLNAEGRNSGWNDNAVFGITVGGNNSSEIAMIQYPNRCSIGDVLKTQIYLVNEETLEMVTYQMIYQIVESIEEIDEVGSENLVLPVSISDSKTVIDLAPAAEALGVTVDDLLDKNNYYLRGLGGGIYGERANADAGLSFNYDGEFDAAGDIYFWFEKHGSDIEIISACNDQVDEDFKVNAQFCFQVDTKQYVYYVQFVSPEIAEGIETIGAETKADARIFDLSGRQVQKPVRGLYIQSGKKFVVK